jgi:hypothetical protein
VKRQRRGAQFGSGDRFSDAWLIHESRVDAPMIEGRYYMHGEMMRMMGRCATDPGRAAHYNRLADEYEPGEKEAREERNLRREIHRLRPRKRYSRAELRRQYRA